jgi:hypothetical protein
MQAIFIRHGQSTGNAGIPCHDLALLELTELGHKQAREVAASWTETPSLIVTSPYLRTHQTAAPTIERFPNVPVEVWPIQEFTYRPAQANLPGACAFAAGDRAIGRAPADQHPASGLVDACPGRDGGYIAGVPFGVLLRHPRAVEDRRSTYGYPTVNPRRRSTCNA